MSSEETRETEAARHLPLLFGKALKARERPSIEDYLAQVPDPEQPELLAELVREEHAFRWQAGEMPTLTEYMARFPDRPGIVEQAFFTTPDGVGVRYALVKQLGEGGFGIVFCARDTALGRDVALKVLHQRKATDARFQSQFDREIQLVAALDHQHIVKIHDSGIFDDGRRFVVMAYIDGGTLEDRLKQGPFQTVDAVELLIPVVGGVVYAHRCDLVAHRDLKPANILLDKTGKPYIADFGLAVTSDEERLRRQEGAGTRAYMAPEQVRNRRYGRNEPLHGSDVWQLGVIFYEMLTGRRPFEGTTRDELYDEIERGTPIPPRRIRPQHGLDERLEQICLRCMAKEPNDRYTTADDLRDALQKWLDCQRGRPLLEREVVSFQDAFDRHAEFVGRQVIVDHVGQFLALHPRGLLIVKGPPGKGKSALLAHLARTLPGPSQPRPVWFFYDRQRGIIEPDQCVRHLYASLLMSHDLVTHDNARLPPDGEEVFRRLQTVLAEIGTGLSAGAPLFILIDALDEAGRSAGSPTAFDRLRLRLPEHVYIVATTHHVPELEDLPPEVHVIDMENQDWKHADRRDGLEYAQGQLADVLSSDTLLQEIAKLGDGNFLVLKLLCRRVKELDCRLGDVQQLLCELAVEVAPDRLGFFYRGYWRRLKRKLDESAFERDDSAFERVVKVFQILAFAQTDVTVDMIRTITKLDFAKWELTREVMEEWLYVVPADQKLKTEERLRLFHASFGEFLRDKFNDDRQQCHDALANFCLRWSQRDGFGRSYGLRFGPTHLREAVRRDELANLLGDFSFVAARLEAGRIEGWPLTETLADYEQTLDFLEGVVDFPSLEAGKGRPMPEWCGECVAAVLVGRCDRV